jgi:predicted permease
MWTFLYGLAVGACAAVLGVSAHDGAITIHWFTWLLGLLAVGLLGLTLQTAIASFRGREPRAGWMSLVFLGVPAVVLCGLTLLTVSVPE